MIECKIDDISETEEQLKEAIVEKIKKISEQLLNNPRDYSEFDVKAILLPTDINWFDVVAKWLNKNSWEALLYGDYVVFRFHTYNNMTDIFEVKIKKETNKLT